jgi:hypothetical protein
MFLKCLALGELARTKYSRIHIRLTGIYHGSKIIAHTKNCRNIMNRTCRIGISDYTKNPALVSSHHEQISSNPKEIVLPTMASPVACQKNRKGKSLKLNFQREKSAEGLRSTLRREKSVPRGLGLGLYRVSSVSRCLGVGNLTSRVMQGREEEMKFDFPKRPRTKSQGQRDFDKDGSASPRKNIKIVYDSNTQKHSIVSDVVAVSPVKQSRRGSMSSMIFHGGPSIDVEERGGEFPCDVKSHHPITDSSLYPTKYPVNVAPEDRRKFGVPIEIVVVSSALKDSMHVGNEVSSLDISHAHTENFKSRSPSGFDTHIQELMEKIDKLDIQ